MDSFMSLEEWCVCNGKPEILKAWSNKNACPPSEIPFGSGKKCWWVCEKGHTWETTPNKVTQRKHIGCPFCTNQRVLVSFNDLSTTNPELAAEWHPTKNDRLHPCDVTAGSNRVIWWKCSNGHEWKSRVADRMKGKGCPYCKNRKLFSGFNDLQTKYPELAKEWHPYKNGDLTPDKVIAGSNRVVWWMCNRGHEFQASLSNRTKPNGTGCPYCANRAVWKGYNDLLTLRPDIAKEWHPIKNGTITPADVTIGSHTKYWWRCPFGHEYQAAPESRVSNHSKGTGCPICASEMQTSFPEQCLYYYLKRCFPKAKNRYQLDGKEIDIFIPEKNIGIEYDGFRYHTEKNRNREIEKDAYFADRNIRIIRVKEYRNKHSIISKDIIWVDERKSQFEELSIVLNKLFENLDIDYSVDKNTIAKDSATILGQYNLSVKEKSFAGLFPQLLTEWDYLKNGMLNPYSISVKSGKRVWWICEKGHEYIASIDSRVGREGDGTGCPYCAGQKVLSGYNDLQTRFPAIATEWDYELNGHIKPDSCMPYSAKKVWWKCRNGHSYQSSIASRTKMGSGCPYCAGKRVIKGINDFESKFPEIASEWCYEMNEDLLPSQFAPASHKKVWWSCPKGHTYCASISSRTRKDHVSGCPYCSNQKVLAGFNDLKTRFPEVAQLWHPTKNGDLMPNSVAPFSTKKVWWLDSSGKEYERRIDAQVAMFRGKIDG